MLRMGAAPAATMLCVAVVAAALVGCGNTTDDSSATVSETSAARPSESPTPSKPPEVSEKTTCDLLFDQKAESPLSVAIDFTLREHNTQAQADATQEALDSLRSIASSASEHLAGQINAVADIVQELLDQALAQTADGTFDTTPLKAAALELTNSCVGYY